MNREQLTELIKSKRSYLCVGLDTDPAKIPSCMHEQYDDPVFEFNRRIIDATIDLAVAYKPNIAFYESGGSKGWRSLEKTINYLNVHPGGPVFTIADAKRGDIGNSSRHYARAFFEKMAFDAVTVNPYMGRDSIEAFLSFEGKWAVVLALTSNTGALDFQALQPQLPILLEKFGIKTSYWKKLFEVVIEVCIQWGTTDNLMFVIGATQTELLGYIRENVPDHFFLVPGVGAQGGNLEDISRVLFNKNIGLLVNVSRGIIFASSEPDFDNKARQSALAYQQQMESLLKQRNFI
jgi:orotidine-5'-phosphate decarboxylase